MPAGEVIILLGSNIDPAENIRRGAHLLSKRLPILRASSVWLTLAVGTNGPDFYNAAVLCQTNATEDILKHEILRPLETSLGRVRTSNKYAPRTLDMDMIILDGIVLDVRLWNTAFIMLPVAELEPALTSPLTGEPLGDLARKIEPASGARRLVDFPLFV